MCSDAARVQSALTLVGTDPEGKAVRFEVCQVTHASILAVTELGRACCVCSEAGFPVFVTCLKVCLQVSKYLLSLASDSDDFLSTLVLDP